MKKMDFTLECGQEYMSRDERARWRLKNAETEIGQNIFMETDRRENRFSDKT